MSPSVPGSRCVEPGCGELAPFGQARCERHATELSRDLHAGSHRRIYLTAAWAGARRSVLERDPTCRCRGACHPEGGCSEPSRDVDHVVPLREVLRASQDPFDPANLRGMCTPCHSRKTAEEVSLGG